MKIELIIFDLFGTLIHSKVKMNLYAKLFDSLELTKDQKKYWRNKIMTTNFKSFSELADMIGQNLNICAQNYDWTIKKEIQGTVLFDDTTEVLESLSRRYKISLISNLSSPYKECFYNLGLDKWIKDPVFSCDCGFVKPQVEIYELVLKNFKVSASKTLMVGDSMRSDVLGPKKVGISTVHKNGPLKLILKNYI